MREGHKLDFYLLNALLVPWAMRTWRWGDLPRR